MTGTRMLDESFLRALEQLSFVSRRVRRRAVRGERATVRHGASLEFSDHRAYQPGDDFRYLDWNIYMRLQRLFVKVFTAEENLTVHILIDTSRSMSFGDPPKLWYAGRLAAALGYLAAVDLDRVGVCAFADGIERSMPPIRTRAQITSLFGYIESLTARGATDFNAALTDYSLAARRPGLAIVITDLLDPGGYEQGLGALLYRAFDVVLLHVLSTEEVTPSVNGLVRLVDSETGEQTSITAGASLTREYSARLSSFLERVERFCGDRAIDYVRATTDIPFERVILDSMRRGAFVR